MARIWTSGAEWGDATAEAVTLNSASVSSLNPRTGTFHFRQHVANTLSSAFTGALSTTYFFRVYASVSLLPSGDGYLMAGIGDTGVSRVSVRLNADGSVDLRQGGSTIIATLPAGTVSAGAYFSVEVSLKVNGVNNADFEGRFNGVSFGTGTGTLAASIAPTIVVFGQSDATNNVDTDDIALNDSTGASQTSWPGDGKIVLLKPISDNAVGAGWVNDANSATNIWTAVSNTPPKGTVNSTTTGGTHQIADATTGAVEAYDANLTTYTAAGVGASDTINFAQPFVATGAPVSTSAKTGALGIVSNPVIGTVNFADGGAVDAFWSGVTASAYPTGWKWSPGGTVNNPSVTLGTSPVMRVVQIDSSTRVAMVCAMGMYVDYTPAAVTAVVRPTLTMAPPIPSRRSLGQVR